MHKNGSSSTNYSIRKVDGWKINKHGGSNKGMVGGSPFFLQNKYRWRHPTSIPQSKSSFRLDTFFAPHLMLIIETHGRDKITFIFSEIIKKRMFYLCCRYFLPAEYLTSTLMPAYLTTPQ